MAHRTLPFTVDTTVIPFIVLMVTLVSILGAGFLARRIVEKRAVMPLNIKSGKLSQK